MKCPVCQKEFESHTGRRPKRFCSDPCKVKYFNIQKKASKVNKRDIEAASKMEEIINSAVQKRSVRSNKEIKERIAQLEKEIASPPTNLIMGAKMYKNVREKELKELKALV